MAWLLAVAGILALLGAVAIWSVGKSYAHAIEEYENEHSR